MRRFLLGLAAGLALTGALAIASNLVPTPSAAPLGNFAEVMMPGLPQTTTLAATGSACSVPGNVNCTVISGVAGGIKTGFWNCLTLHVKNTGATNNVDHILIEQGPDGTNWENLTTVSNLFNALTPGTLIDANFCPVSYPYLRVEAQSVSGTTTSVWMSAYRD